MSSISIQFDSTEICNSTYLPRFIKHESVAEREIATMKLAREDGAIFVSEKYGIKKIIVSGKLTGSSRNNLESAIDTFTELFGRSERNLDITWNGSTRRYVATCVRHEFDRDHFHDFFVPWVAEFMVAEGFGKDTSLTASLDGVDAQPTYTGSATFSGSARPKPIITLTFGSGWSNAKGIKIENTDTDEEMVINYSSGFSQSDVLEIDCENKTVELNSTSVDFYRVFPSFAVGSNGIQITAGDIIDQAFEPSNDDLTSTGSDQMSDSQTDYLAQSFTVPRSDSTYQGIALKLHKTIDLDADITVEIQTDSNGEPSGSAVTNASFTLDGDDIPVGNGADSAGWVFANSASAFSLSANTVYWIVAKRAGAEVTIVMWPRAQGATVATYGRGFLATSDDSGSTWDTDDISDDRPFRLYYGGKADSPTGNLTLDIDYYKKYL